MDPEQLRKARQDDFLRVYAHLGCVRSALRHCGISHCALHGWRHNDPEFRARYEKTQDSLLDQINDIAYSMALGGDIKAIALVLRHRHPSYRQQKDVVVSGKDDAPPVRVAGMSVAQARKYIAESIVEGDSDG